MGKFSKYSNSRKKNRSNNRRSNRRSYRRKNQGRKSIKQKKYKQNGGNPVSWLVNHLTTDARNLINTWLPLSYDVKNSPSEFVHNVRGKEWKDSMTGDPVKQKLDLDAKIKPAIVSLPSLLRSAQATSGNRDVVRAQALLAHEAALVSAGGGRNKYKRKKTCRKKTHRKI